MELVAIDLPVQSQRAQLNKTQLTLNYSMFVAGRRELVLEQLIKMLEKKCSHAVLRKLLWGVKGK